MSEETEVEERSGSALSEEELYFLEKEVVKLREKFAEKEVDVRQVQVRKADRFYDQKMLKYLLSVQKELLSSDLGYYPVMLVTKRFVDDLVSLFSPADVYGMFFSILFRLWEALIRRDERGGVTIAMPFPSFEELPDEVKEALGAVKKKSKERKDRMVV